MKRILLLLAILALAAGCARGVGNPPATTPVPDPTESADPVPTPSNGPRSGAADELVLRMEYTGGFVPVEWIRTNVPVLSVYADGTLINVGPTTMEYPGRALPNLQTSQLSPEQLTELLDAAAAAGLADGDQDLPLEPMTIADASTTVLTVVLDGETSVTSAYALMEAGAETSPERAAMREFIDTELGELQMTGGDPYQISQMRVWVSPATQDQVEPDFVTEMEWPLAGDLASFGEPSAWGPADQVELRCGTVSGEELETLLAALADANQATMFTSAGDLFSVQFRPLLPDEAGCPAASSGP